MSKMTSEMERWRGLTGLVREIVDSGASAVEKVHLATAGRTFSVLEAVEPLRPPVQVIHTIHDASVSTIYGVVRLVTRAAAATVDTALALVEKTAEPSQASPETDDHGEHRS